MTDAQQDSSTLSRFRPAHEGDQRSIVGSALPRVPDSVVERPHLNELLSSFDSLAILHAPAGFGKTTLAAAWARDSQDSTGDIVWFDAKRSDEHSFWSDLLVAFEESGILVPNSGPASYQRVSAALHDRSCALTVVVDGFDSVSESAVIEEELHDLLVRRRSLRVVVTLRRIHPFTSARWSDLDVMFIGAHELAFSPDETARLAALFGCSLSAEMAMAVTNATRGWPEPTRALIAQVHRGSLAPGDIPETAARVAHEYLVMRVIPLFDGHEWLHFMFTTSVPRALTEQLAVFVSGDSTAPERLQRLESEGVLAVTNTETGPVFEWPSAARAALRAEFIRRDPGGEREIHRRLAGWHLEREQADDALEHAELAQDPDVLVRVIEREWPRLLAWHRDELRSVFSSLPIESLTGHPGAAAVRDMVLHLQSQPDDLFLSMIGPGPGDRKEIARIARSEDALIALRTMEAIMLALRIRGRFRHATRYADAIEIISTIGREHQTAQIAPVAPSIFLQNGITRLAGDDLARALLDLRFSYERSAEGSSPYTGRDAAGKIVLLHALTGDVKSAEAWLRRYTTAAETSGWLASTISQSVALASAIIAIERLDRNRASAHIAKLAVPLNHEQTWSPFLTYVQARYALVWGDRHDALLRVKQERIHHADWVQEGATANALLYAVEADLLMALGLGNRAREILTQSPRHPALFAARARFALIAESGEAAIGATSIGVDEATSTTVRAELLLVRAIAEWESGDERAAVDSIRYAVNVARTTGSTYAFATVSKRLAPIAEHNPEAMRLLKAAEASGASPIFPTQLAIVFLTERERMVLNRIALGMNMREMADDLFVSYNTVKTQMRSLYQKLGARSRDQALARAHENGLLGRAQDDRAS